MTPSNARNAIPFCVVCLLKKRERSLIETIEGGEVEKNIIENLPQSAVMGNIQEKTRQY